MDDRGDRGAIGATGATGATGASEEDAEGSVTRDERASEEDADRREGDEPGSPPPARAPPSSVLTSPHKLHTLGMSPPDGSNSDLLGSSSSDDSGGKAFHAPNMNMDMYESDADKAAAAEEKAEGEKGHKKISFQGRLRQMMTEVHKMTTPSHRMLTTSRRATFICISFVMMLLQIGALAAYLSGMLKPTCSELEDCNAGTYCNLYSLTAGDAHHHDDKKVNVLGTNASTPVGDQPVVAKAMPHVAFGDCLGCPSDWIMFFDPKAPQNKVSQCDRHYKNNTYADGAKQCVDKKPDGLGGYTAPGPGREKGETRKHCEMRHSWLAQVCDQCKQHTRGKDVYMTFHQIIDARILNMRTFEWLMLVMVMLVIAIRVSGVIRDTAVVELTRRSTIFGTPWQGAMLSPRRLCACFPDFWHVVVGSLYYLRWGLLLPLVIMAIPMCVLYRGSDAVNVAMDTVAIMFMLEIDRLIFEHGISEDTKLFVQKYGKDTVAAWVRGRRGRRGSVGTWVRGAGQKVCAGAGVR